MKLKFAKPVKRTKVKKFVNRVKKTPLAKLKRMADKLAGEKCRARGLCESCGSTHGLQWCHIFSRRYQNIRWDMGNCLCMCSGCHFKYTNHPTLWVEFLTDKHPEKLSRLIGLKNNFEIKVNREFMEKVLENLK